MSKGPAETSSRRTRSRPPLACGNGHRRTRCRPLSCSARQGEGDLDNICLQWLALPERAPLAFQLLSPDIPVSLAPSLAFTLIEPQPQDCMCHTAPYDIHMYIVCRERLTGLHKLSPHCTLPLFLLPVSNASRAPCVRVQEIDRQPCRLADLAALRAWLTSSPPCPAARSNASAAPKHRSVSPGDPPVPSWLLWSDRRERGVESSRLLPLPCAKRTPRQAMAPLLPRPSIAGLP